MFVRSGAVLLAAAVMLATIPHEASAANRCRRNPGTPDPWHTHDANYVEFTAANLGCPNNTFCDCGLIEGDNCKIKLTGNEDFSGTTCMELGDGVTLDMHGYTLNCTAADCGYGVINSASSGAADKVLIKNGKITGCFDAGIYVNGGTDSSVTDMVIDLGLSCTNSSSSTGISAPRGTISRVEVYHTNVGVWLASGGETIEDSVLKDNVHGMIAAGVGTIDNVTFQENSAAHIWEYKGSFDPDISGSTFTGTGCNCSMTPSGASTTESCQTGGLRECGTFQAPPSIVCDPPDDGSGTDCSIEE